MSEPLGVLVLGYGEMGHAMEYLLRERARLEIWEMWPKDGFRPAELDQATPRADIVVFCLPAQAHREVAARIAPLINKDSVCLTIAKGLDEAGETAAQVFQDVLGQRQPFAVLYGPMISEEIRAGRHAFAQLGCRDKAVFARVRGLFAGTRLHVEHTLDVPGISWSVILKNVYALAFGIADELQLGDNVRGCLAVASLLELDRLVEKMGGRPGTVYHLAGLGDLITTGTSVDSHHHELGRRLARGETQAIEGEGIHTLNMVSKYRLFTEADYPLFSLIHEIVRDPRHARDRFNAYLQ